MRLVPLSGGLAAALLIAALSAPAAAQTATEGDGQPAGTTGQPQATEPAGAADAQPTEGEAQPQSEQAGESQDAEGGPDAPLEERGYALGDVVLGDPDAPLTVVEYASFTCPHCARFAADTFPQVKEQYIDTGKIRFILRDVYFDQYGLWASMVARCGGEEGFYPLAETYLATQSSWTGAEDIGAAIQQIGRRAGLPPARLQQCLSDREYAKRLLETYQQNAAADEVRSTPTFIIAGEQHNGAMSFEDFSAILDAAL